MLNVLKNLDWSILMDMLISALAALIPITIHECSHGFAAYLLGDRTAKAQGRLSLNPLKHVDITGLIMLAVFNFGWAKPVPINMRNFKDPKKGMAVSALAGPLANMLFAVILIFVYGMLFVPLKGGYYSDVSYYTLLTIGRMAYINVTLGLFNLIPIPPLDGSKVLFSFISQGAYYKLMRYERYGMVLLVLLMTVGSVNGFLSAVFDSVFSALLPIADFGAKLVSRMM